MRTFPDWLSNPEPGDRSNNPKHYRRTLKYHRQKFLATPPWLSKEDRRKIGRMQREIKKRNRAGANLTLDHIVPLQSDFVCGLHVPWNLLFFPAGSNFSKCNTYWPDCPWENLSCLDHEHPEPHQLKLF